MEYRVAVVDDDASNLKAAKRILSFHGYRVDCLNSGEELLEFVKDNTPDLILLDLHMEGIDGFETFLQLKKNKKSRDIPVIFLTADNDGDTETKALAAGAMDFVAKPFIPSVLVMRARNTIELMRLQTDLKKEVRNMTKEIIKEHEKNERLSLQIVKTLAGTIDAKDSYTKGHSSRVAEYSKEIARRAGYSERAQEDIYMMGLLHDVGKIGISDAIINKRTHLTDEEYDQIKTHPTVGFEILRNITEMPKLAIGARWHHERYDGKGYPDGLSGKDIPEEARIISVADAYDAMSSMRSYHDIFAQSYIIEEIKKGKGTQFDPEFADIMLSIIYDDKDYKLKEQPVNKEENEAPVERDGSNDKMFSFLAILDIGGLNTAIGMKYCMNDVDFYLEMLDEFTESFDDRADKLISSFEKKEIDKYRIAVHSLKSASKTIGAQHLSDRAKALEDAAKDNNYEYIAAHHEELLESLKVTVSGILMATSMYE